MQDGEMIIYHTDDGKAAVTLMSRDGSVWLTQKQMAELYGVSVPNISMLIAKIIKEGELDSNSVIKYYLTTAKDGKQYQTCHYSLNMILAVGFRARGVRGTQFRQWANLHLAEFLVKGFVMDDQRLKNPDGRPDYFDELLARIRDIRASEKRFYQKLRDLFALSSDYISTDEETRLFFALVQNKLIYAVTRKTAAELIVDRADPAKANMGLTAWRGGVVRKEDIYIAKNYLTNDELDDLNRIVMMFLESAEFRVKHRKDLTMSFWKSDADRIISAHGLPMSSGAGCITHGEMLAAAEERYERFDARRKREEAEMIDAEELRQLELLEEEIKKKGV